MSAPELITGWGVDVMEFKLRYRGALPSGRYQTEAKHRIRAIFHAQLADLTRDARFRDAASPGLQPAILKGRYATFPEGVEHQFFYVALNGFRFVPFVSRPHLLVAQLEISLGRRESPGDIFHDGGDLDNRLKTLLDALRMPHDPNELRGLPLGDGEERFYCLLEDDSLVTRIEIDTYQLLGPLQDGEQETDVQLDIKVIVESGGPRMGNITF